jgi:hypothetical protein
MARYSFYLFPIDHMFILHLYLSLAMWKYALDCQLEINEIKVKNTKETSIAIKTPFHIGFINSLYLYINVWARTTKNFVSTSKSHFVQNAKCLLVLIIIHSHHLNMREGVRVWLLNTRFLSACIFDEWSCILRFH